MIRRGVICDECLVEAEAADGVILRRTAADARREARGEGWVITRRGDTCPDCAAAR